VPARWLAGVVASSVALSVLGVAALEGARTLHVQLAGGHGLFTRAVPLAVASTVFGAGYLALLLWSSRRVPIPALAREENVNAAGGPEVWFSCRRGARPSAWRTGGSIAPVDSVRGEPAAVESRAEQHP
jgi:hypothetical protein